MFTTAQLIFTGALCFLFGALTVIVGLLIFVEWEIMRGKKDQPSKDEWKGLP